MRAKIKSPAEPDLDCTLCPRLAQFRQQHRELNPTWHNAPVSSFGAITSSLLIVGMAPGLKGANCTGRPFTGDYAGDLLYSTLDKFDFSKGSYDKTAEDGLKLVNCRITNAVKCVPPQNKPVASEVNACKKFLIDEITAMKNLKVIVALGGLSHGAILATLGLKKSDFKFGHGAIHKLILETTNLILIDSYHCSRYNTNTRKLTEAMFCDVFSRVKTQLATGDHIE